MRHKRMLFWQFSVNILLLTCIMDVMGANLDTGAILNVCAEF